MSKKAHTFTLGIEEEFAIIDPESRASYARTSTRSSRTVRSRSRSRSNPRCISRWSSSARRFASHRSGRARTRSRTSRQTGGTGGARRFEDCIRRDSSVFTLARSTHHRRRALRGDRERHAIAGARQSDFRIARARRHSRSRVCHPGDESDALLFCRTFMRSRSTHRSGSDAIPV